MLAFARIRDILKINIVTTKNESRQVEINESSVNIKAILIRSGMKLRNILKQELGHFKLQVLRSSPGFFVVLLHALLLYSPTNTLVREDVEAAVFLLITKRLRTL